VLDMARISTLRNLGPVMERLLAEIDVHTHDDLMELGAIEAWRRLSFIHPRTMTRLGLYAMAGALIDRDWRDLPPDLKASLDEAAAQTRAARRSLRDRPAKRR
jgi:DNA transformation protein